MFDTSSDPKAWLINTKAGLWCAPGQFYIDPQPAVARAVVTHGHGDHARRGHRAVLCTAETAAIMRVRYGDDAAHQFETCAYGKPQKVGDVTVTLEPAGHILGSAQVVLDYRGFRVVVSGDYKRRPDPTCAPFEPVTCDLFVTEATFALPVFRHPPDRGEIGKLLDSVRNQPDRCHLVGVYALGKCQRVIALLRQAGYDRPIWLHGALVSLCELYHRQGIGLGALKPVTAANKHDLAGAIVLSPPSATADRWARDLPDPVIAAASGWLRVRQRARQRGVELPMVISDHADWDELTATLDDVAAPRVWVTHGREDALVFHARSRGLDAEALSLIGFDEDSA